MGTLMELELRGGPVVYQVCPMCGRTAAIRLPVGQDPAAVDSLPCVCQQVSAVDTPHLLVLSTR